MRWRPWLSIARYSVYMQEAAHVHRIACKSLFIGSGAKFIICHFIISRGGGGVGEYEVEKGEIIRKGGRGQHG